MLTRRIFSMMSALAAVLAFVGPVFADEVVDGSTGPGSVYRLVRPTKWNGTLSAVASAATSSVYRSQNHAIRRRRTHGSMKPSTLK